MHAGGLLTDVVREDHDASPRRCRHSCRSGELKLTVGYVSRLERGTESPKGPTLVLVDVLRRKGFEAIL
jgi:hypothetical protein